MRKRSPYSTGHPDRARTTYSGRLFRGHTHILIGVFRAAFERNLGATGGSENQRRMVMVLIEPSPPTRPTTWRTATCSIFGDAEAFARAHNVPERVQRLLTRSAVPGSSLARPERLQRRGRRISGPAQGQNSGPGNDDRGELDTETRN
jgi:hypothetical protein